MKMTHEQIEEINTLLITSADALTAFYDEGIDLGFKRGLGLGAGITLLGVFLGSKCWKFIGRKKHPVILESES